MVIQVKDSNGKVVIEREIDKEEVLLKVRVKEDDLATGESSYSLEQVFGSYH